jgi:hypothetical protein
MNVYAFALFLFLFALPAFAQSSNPLPDQRLYEKIRAEVLLKLSDEDLANYCIATKFGGELLPELRKEVFEGESELASLQSEGIQETHPKFRAAASVLKIRRQQLASELASLRKGLEIEHAIAQASLAELNKRSKFF